MNGNWILLRTNDEPNVMTANGLISPFFFPLWTCHFWETSLNIVVRWGWGVGCSKAFTRECQPTLQCNMYMLAEWVFMLCGHIPVISSKSLRYLVAFKEGDWRFSADVLTHSRPVAVLVPLRAVAYQSVLHVLLLPAVYQLLGRAIQTCSFIWRQTDRHSDTPSASHLPPNFYLHWIFKFQEMQSL